MPEAPRPTIRPLAAGDEAERRRLRAGYPAFHVAGARDAAAATHGLTQAGSADARQLRDRAGRRTGRFHYDRA